MIIQKRQLQRVYFYIIENLSLPDILTLLILCYPSVFNFKYGGKIAENISNDIYLFKVNNRITRKRCEICLQLTKKNTRSTSLTLFWCFFVNFEHISHLFLVFFL